MWNHWTVHTNAARQPLQRFETASWAWRGLRRLFPEALAAVLMPDHLHLVLKEGAASPARSRLTGFLGAMSRYCGVPGLWQQPPEPRPLGSPSHVRRCVRYIALNPCRGRLCGDPMEWLWSTHRDVLGAVADPWIAAPRLARALGEPAAGFEVRHHAYVSGDPSVSIGGTPSPRAAPPSGGWPSGDLGGLLRACAAALRVSPSSIRVKGARVRVLLAHLARRQGWDAASLLAEVGGVSRQSVYRWLAEPAPRGLEAAALCLGDARLRRWVPGGLPPHPSRTLRSVTLRQDPPGGIRP